MSADTKQDRLSSLNSLYVIQNADKIARRADYMHLAPDELLVHGIFCTLQGEGPFVGSPCVFVRLAGCNLGDKKSGFCAFCDTDFKLENGKKMVFSQIMNTVLVEWGTNVRRACKPLMVITGGEPGLQPAIVDFIKYVNKCGWEVQVETNGTQRHFALAINGYVKDSSEYPTEDDDIPLAQRRVTLVVSPKAGVAGYPIIEPMLWGQGANVLKLVVESDHTSPHHHIPQFAYTWNEMFPGKVYLSPIAVYLKEYKGEISSAWEDGLLNKERTRKNYSYAASMCRTNGFKLSIQQHIFAEIA
jgi:organic radical activating enzyme